MKDYFKPADFVFGLDSRNEEAAQIANEKLNKLIESWPVVYFENATSRIRHCSEIKHDTDTHSARLAFIEPIVIKECIHEPVTHGGLIGYKCKHCGVELQATWSEKKNENV